MSSLLLVSVFILVVGLFNLLGIDPRLFRDHLINVIVGIGTFFLVRKIGIHFFRANYKTFYFVFLGLLALTYIVGIEVKGSKRWIDLFIFSFQASEFYKVFLMVFFAEYFIHNRRNIYNTTFLFKSLGYFFVPAFLVFKQPDLGNTLVYSAIFFSMAFFSGIPKINLFKILLIITAIIPFGWFVLKDYQKIRILSFFNPHLDQAGNAYNMIQAMVTVGSGKFLGRGLGMGTQSGLYFLPENHTDFAYSSLTEQFGFVGGWVVIVLYTILAVILIKKIITYYYERSEEGKFKFLFTIGFFSYFIIHVFVNIGMNLGIMPITGITLPLISYGGSSLITWMIALALIP